MPEPPKPPKPPKHHDPTQAGAREELRALNTEENAVKAVATAQAAVSSLEAGAVFVKREPQGELIVKGVLCFGGVHVAALRFDPASGAVMPKGLHPMPAEPPESLDSFAEKLAQLSKEITVVPGAEFREPEFCWAIPLVHSGRIVGDIKVSADGEKIVADRKLEGELPQG